MALGKAYIEVHADTKPFARELGRELNRIVKEAEKTVRINARATGSTITKEISKGVEKDKKRVAQAMTRVVKDATPIVGGAFGRFAKGIIDSIDDGISGLPDEIKVVLGAALVAALPLIYAMGSAIATALTAGLTVGAAGLFGVLVGSQIEEVQTRFENLGAQIQKQFASAVTWLAGPINQALDLVAVRFEKLLPSIAFLAQAAVSTLEPLVDAVFGLVESALPGLKNAFAGIGKFLVPLQVGFRRIGTAIGTFFDELTSTPLAVEAFYDLLVFVSDLIDLFRILIEAGLGLYHVFRKIGEALGVVEPVTEQVSRLAKEYGIGKTNAEGFSNAISGTNPNLEKQNELFENINKELETYTNLLIESGNQAIDWEEHLDNFTKSVKENGRTLDIGSEKGRENARALRQLAIDAVKTRQTTIDLTGDVDEANRRFKEQSAQIYGLAAQMKLSKKDTENLIGALLAIPPPQETGPSQGSLNRLAEYYSILKSLENIPNIAKRVIGLGVSAAIGNIQAHASGGVFSTPHMGLVAEAGPEAIIPLNKPARAAQIMNQSGLSGMVSPSVTVYIGNQQIDAYIDNRVDGAMRSFSRSLSYGSRVV